MPAGVTASRRPQASTRSSPPRNHERVCRVRAGGRASRRANKRLSHYWREASPSTFLFYFLCGPWSSSYLGQGWGAGVGFGNGRCRQPVCATGRMTQDVLPKGRSAVSGTTPWLTSECVSVLNARPHRVLTVLVESGARSGADGGESSVEGRNAGARARASLHARENSDGAT